MSGRESTKPGEYDTTDPERLERIDKLVDQIEGVAPEKLAPYRWEDRGIRETEGMVLDPDWQVVPNPWEEASLIEAASITSEDPDDGSRSFSIVRKKDDGGLHVMASLYHLSSHRVLMMPRVPNEELGFVLISWASDDAEAFLGMSEGLLAGE